MLEHNVIYIKRYILNQNQCVSVQETEPDLHWGQPQRGWQPQDRPQRPPGPQPQLLSQHQRGQPWEAARQNQVGRLVSTFDLSIFNRLFRFGGSLWPTFNLLRPILLWHVRLYQGPYIIRSMLSVLTGLYLDCWKCNIRPLVGRSVSWLVDMPWSYTSHSHFGALVLL